MSQYPPSPFQPPQPGYQSPYGYDPYADPLAACKRASVLMFVIGGLAIVLAGCMGAMASSSVLEQAMNQPNAQLPPGMSLDDLRTAAMVTGVIVAVGGVLFLVLGAFVRRGSKGAAVTSIVVTILGLGFMLLNIVMAWVTQPQQAAAGTCMMILPLGLLAWLLVWLFGASAAAGRAAHWPAQYGGQYQQYQQYPGYPPQQPGYPPQQQQGYPSQQPQVWQQPGQWQQQPPPPPPPQNWPPPRDPG